MKNSEYIKLTRIKLKDGTSLDIPADKGDAVRAQKAKGKGSVYLESLNKRMIDVAMIGEIEDVTIKNPDYKPLPSGAKQLESGRSSVVDENSPGYIAFLKAREKLIRKLSGGSKSE